MPHVLAILEDDTRRAAAMAGAAATLAGVVVVFHDSAPEMVAWLGENLDLAAVLALDHDLGPTRVRDGERFDPGIGRAVADFLAEHAPSCPVVIHSSNSPAALGMQLCLGAAGWTVTRVHPFDDLAWIERDWLPEIRRALADR